MTSVSRSLLASIVLLSACGQPRAAAVRAVDVAVPDNKVVRFVAVGDTGHGNETEYAVARAIQKTCAAHGGCAFGLLLGDNIYPQWITSPDDPAMVSKFERPYAIESFPFYAALGNHDYGLSWEFWRAENQIAYSANSTKFRMPARHYSFGAGPVDFFAIDTNALFWDATSEERTALREERADSHRAWRIAYGHHPFVSNGKHGNAGHYEGIPFSWLPAAGGDLEEFFKDEICGKFDVYLSGHDHTLQDLGERCGTQFLISGAGSETTALKGHDPSLFQASIPGFVFIEATTQRLKITFVDLTGHELYRREVNR